jgi:alkylation response protein AidB-like acyl-CoA dehydrogenase
MTPRERKAKEQEKDAQAAGDEAAQAVKDRTGVGEKPPSDPDQVREEIAETRAELGDTVEALADKADVKAQAKQKIEQRKEQLRETQEQAKEKLGEVSQQAQERPAPVAAIAGGAFVLLLLLWLKRRR